MTDVDIVSQNGADNGSFEADDYLGIVFEGKVGGQETYRYEIAWQGATDTVLVNTSQQLTFPFYADADADGYGDAENVTYAAATPDGYVESDADCDDTNASINPDAPEVADGIDNDCDTEIDEGLDVTAPTVMSITRQSPATEVTSADALTWRVTFSEAVMNVDVTDFAISGSSTATVTGLSGSGTTYDVTASGGNLATFTGAVPLGFAGGQNIVDLSANALVNTTPSGTNEPLYQLDNLSDLVTLATADDTVSGDFQVTMTFQKNGPADAPHEGQTEALTVLNQMQLTNAELTGPSITFDGNVITFYLAPLAEGQVTAVLPAGAAFDDAGNGTLSSNTLSVTYEIPNNAPTANAGEDQVVSSNTGVGLDGSASSANDSGQTLTYVWTQTAGPTVELLSPDGEYPLFSAPQLEIGDQDVVMTFSLVVNDGIADSTADTVDITVKAPVDEEKPVITAVENITVEAGPGGTASVPFSATVTDNHDTNVVPVFTFDNGVITSPHVFPLGVHLVLVDAQDTAGNDATTVQFTVTVTSGVAPDAPLITTADINGNRSMTIGGTAEDGATVRVTFPDDSFIEVSAIGGTFSVTSAANMQGGMVSVTAQDAGGNLSTAATVDLFPDYEGPTVTISEAPSRVVDETPFYVRVTFSESVTGFEQSEVSVTGGNVTGFIGDADSYQVQIVPIAGEDVTISVAAGVAEDAFGNENVASEALTILNDTLTETEEMVTTAASQRNRMLIRTQPKITRFILRPSASTFNASATQNLGNFDFATSSDRPVWAAGQGQWSTLGDVETSYFNVALGAHFEPSPNVLLGVMAQFDSSTSDDGAAELDSQGWLVGPYAVARLADQPLVFSGSYLMGQSDNTLSPFGTYEDDYTSDRVLATLGVAGQLELDRLTLIPLLDVAYASDENEAYTDGDGNPVRALKVTETQATLGLDFIMPLYTSSGALELLGGIGASASVTDNGVEETDSTRGQTDLGFRYGMENGGRLTARATYDGLGDDDYEAYGAEVIFELKF